MFTRPFWVSLVLTIPVLIYSDLFQDLLGYTAPAFPGSAYLGLVLGSIIYWYGGWVFLTGAVAELRRRPPGMMTLVALAITTAYGYSLAITLGLVQGMPFYWELATLVTIMLLGHWMEMRAVGSAQSALNELARLLPDTAERLVADGTERVRSAALRAGDRVLVRPGAQVPADGTVEEGQSQVDESMITGESRPVDKGPGSEVIAGTVNGSGSLRVRISRDRANSTMLAGIMRLVEEAQTSRTRAQALADRAAYWLTLVAIGMALLALVVWAARARLRQLHPGAGRDDAGGRLPARAGAGDPAGDRDLDHAVGAQRHPGARPAGAGAGPQPERGGLRQDRHADQGRAGLVGSPPRRASRAGEALALAAAVEGDSEHLYRPGAREPPRERRTTGASLPPRRTSRRCRGGACRPRWAGRTLQVGGPRLLEQQRHRGAGGAAPARPQPGASAGRRWSTCWKSSGCWRRSPWPT